MERGRLLWEYAPPRAHPIVYAGLILTSAVFFLGSLENLLRDRRPELYAAYALPPLILLGAFVAFLPSPIRIHEGGIAPSRPLLLRWRRPFLPWDEVAACYPASYDVTGAFVSPFASSDGKVTQTGLGVETRDGRTETVRFTPTRFSLGVQRSRGYKEAVEVVRALFVERGRPMVPDSPRYTEEEKERMLREARKPFLPFFAIVFLFASAAPVVWALTRLAEWRPWPAVAVGLVAPVAVSLRSYAKSRDRNHILDALSKSAEAERGAGPGGAA